MTEVRVVDPNTGGAKGSKPARFDLIPPDVLWELAVHFGKGEEKYPSPEPGIMNWQLGYNWSLSYAALQRHLFLWSKGEDIDEETGTHHLIAVAWHAFCLRWFQEHGMGTDDIGGRVRARLESDVSTCTKCDRKFPTYRAYQDHLPWDHSGCQGKYLVGDSSDAT